MMSTFHSVPENLTEKCDPLHTFTLYTQFTENLTHYCSLLNYRVLSLICHLSADLKIRVLQNNLHENLLYHLGNAQSGQVLIYIWDAVFHNPCVNASVRTTLPPTTENTDYRDMSISKLVRDFSDCDICTPVHEQKGTEIVPQQSDFSVFSIWTTVIWGHRSISN